MSENVLSGKRAIVTGASGGMGAAIATRFAAEGADIWVAGGANTQGLWETIQSCTASGVRADGKGYDFFDSRQGAKAVQDGAAFLGGLDILVNCAGGRNFKPITEVEDEDIDYMYELNIKSIVFASREAARIMVPQGSGHILMMSSISGHRARPDRSLYCSTKAAVDLFTKSLAMELGPKGLRVNAMAPGLIASGRVKTLMEDPEYHNRRLPGIPLGRYGKPENIAATAVFLVSPDNDFMNGAIVDIDGASTSG